MSLLLGIDLGTSYFKVGLFDRSGAIRGLGRERVEKQTPSAGRQELAVGDFWALLRRGLAAALVEARADMGDIAAVSYSSQANTFVLLDRNQAPLTPLIFWTDARATPVDPVAAEFSQRDVFCRTVGFAGLPVESAVNKWRWFQTHEPAIWERARHLMTISDYFAFALTGETIGDASTAAFLGLYDLRGQRWWKEALETFGLDAQLLSDPLRPGAAAGRTGKTAESLLGIPGGVSFAVGGLDHHVAAVGSGVERLADISISTGTVLAALALVTQPEPTPGCYHGPHTDGRRYYRLAFDVRGGGQLEDYQRREAPECSIDELIALAATLRAGGGLARGLDVHAQRHGAGVRELLEQISETHRGLIRRLVGDTPVEAAVATGGATRSAIWLQIMADVLGMPIVTSTCAERACLGAAIFAAIAAGWFRDTDDAMLAMVHAHRTFEPGNARAVRAAQHIEPRPHFR